MSDKSGREVETKSDKEADFSLRKAVSRRVICAALALMVVTLVSMLARFHWAADLLTHFRVQFCVLFLCAAITLLCLKSWRLFGGCILGLAFNAFPLLPYLIPASNADIENRQSYCLYVQNVLTSNHGSDLVLQRVEHHQPDFVALMEVNSRWQTELSVLDEKYPHRKFISDDRGNFGIALYSKYEFSKLEVVSVEPLFLPSLVADVNLSSGGTAELCQLIVTHPIPPVGKRKTAARNKQLMEMASLVADDKPSLLAGDFNLTPWSPVFSDILAESRMRDSAVGFGVSPTWHALGRNVMTGIVIDHVLVSQEIDVLDREIAQDIGSDHLGIVLDFGIESK